MKAPAFKYARPSSLAEAFVLLEHHGDDARILAGGQSLMPSLNMRLSTPHVLVDINRIEGLSGVRLAGGILCIGAMTRHVALEHCPLVAQHAPLIASAMPNVAHAAIRNRGTIGGSLAFADPAAELPACMLALGARLILASAKGRRAVDAADFFQDLFVTALANEEILVEVEIPVAMTDSRHGFLELARRHGDYAIVGVAINTRLRQGVFSDTRLVCFGVGNVPVLAQNAGAALEGRANNPETRDEAASALEGDLNPPSDLNASAEMRVHLAKVLTRRALEGLGS
jgi:aerobic carbon-monoxide dehydrogenase medium subunit